MTQSGHRLGLELIVVKAGSESEIESAIGELQFFPYRLNDAMSAPTPRLRRVSL